MAELRTRIVLRNDSTANWLSNSDAVLLKGEVGFEFLTDGTVKMKIGDGAKTWAELNYFGNGDTASLEEAIAELNADITTLQGKDSDIEASISAINALIGTVDNGKTIIDMISDATYDDRALVSRITINEEAIAVLNGDETVEGSVNKKVADKVTEEIDAFATKISDDGNINTFKELVDYIASHGPEAADMAADIAELQNLVGKTKVSEQIETAIAGKVDKEDGSRLINANEIEKLSKLVIDEDTGDVGLSGSISAENVVGLSDMLAKKVDAESGKSLIDNALISKLEAIDAGAQANKIEAIKVGNTLLDIVEKTAVIPMGAGLQASDEVTISESGTLGVGKIGIGKLIDDGAVVILNGGSAVWQNNNTF